MGALCERVVEASSFMILQEKVFVGLYPDSSGKSLEGLKQTNDVIRFWSWKRPFPLLCRVWRESTWMQGDQARDNKV